ncbi:gastrula zinc finger protein XlCGF66.1-like [Ranitomeya imitator]|uniref:gastrula zinc finger protein XlCGF66.1-like n=1 Tax=Ranitomeya imitator TaxID=111125 RepID=UPI0037E89618
MDSGQMAERILSLTLQIISLLTGEDYMVVRKIGNEADELDRHQGPITTALHSLLQTRNRPQEILEITNTITELLTGEVPLRCQDVALYFSLEEWDYVEGHRGQYQNVMEGLRRVTSPAFVNVPVSRAIVSIGPLSASGHCQHRAIVSIGPFFQFFTIQQLFDIIQQLIPSRNLHCSPVP